MSGETFPRRATGPMWKTPPAVRQKKQVEDKRTLATAETKNKRQAKKRDHHTCRFPLCGCAKRLHAKADVRLESSHEIHKGMGGNPAGDRSAPELLVTLCKHRHQDGAISRHKGTLRAKFLTPEKFNGRIAWEVDVNRLRKDYGAHSQKWEEVAREIAVQKWAPFTGRQRKILELLEEMTL
jgi:hypothetical protein